MRARGLPCANGKMELSVTEMGETVEEVGFGGR